VAQELKDQKLMERSVMSTACREGYESLVKEEIQKTELLQNQLTFAQAKNVNLSTRKDELEAEWHAIYTKTRAAALHDNDDAPKKARLN
jgi:hypothetical protein